jgi:hypothetical protein
MVMIMNELQTLRDEVKEHLLSQVEEQDAISASVAKRKETKKGHHVHLPGFKSPGFKGTKGNTRSEGTKETKVIEASTGLPSSTEISSVKATDSDSGKSVVKRHGSSIHLPSFRKSSEKRGNEDEKSGQSSDSPKSHVKRHGSSIHLPSFRRSKGEAEVPKEAKEDMKEQSGESPDSSKEDGKKRGGLHLPKFHRKKK